MDRIRSRRLRYFKHVVRTQPSRWPHRALYDRVHGNRHRGRPRKCWTDNISDDCQMMRLSLTQATHEAEDRKQRREYTRLHVRACLTAVAITSEEDSLTVLKRAYYLTVINDVLHENIKSRHTSRVIAVTLWALITLQP